MIDDECRVVQIPYSASLHSDYTICRHTSVGRIYTATARRIHVIDLTLKNGIHLVVLMQALLERKTEVIELLKVTVVATSERDKVEESGRRLESVVLHFSFNVIFVNDIIDVMGDSFHIEEGEAVAVYASMALKTMISRQYSLERLTRVIGNLNLSAMVVTETEANHNAPFMTRFMEALFFYGAIFDCLDTFEANEYENKMLMEQHLASRTIKKKHLASRIENMLSTDDRERTARNVKIDVWRAEGPRSRRAAAPATLHSAHGPTS